MSRSKYLKEISDKPQKIIAAYSVGFGFFNETARYASFDILCDVLYNLEIIYKYRKYNSGEDKSEILSTNYPFSLFVSEAPLKNVSEGS